MRRWNLQPALGPWIAAALLALALSGAALAATRLVRAFSGLPESWRIDGEIAVWLIACILLLAVTGWLAYRLAGVLTLSYELDRNGLYIRWLGNRAVVPLDQITTINIGAPGARLPWPFLQGIGSYWGMGRTADGRPLYLFATRRLSRCLVVYTASSAYAISPRDQDAFVQDLEQRRSLGATTSLLAQIEPGRAFSYAFWGDQFVSRVLMLALLLNLALLAYLCTRYPSLAPSLPMQFDFMGSAVGFRPKWQIFFLPFAGLGLLLLNAALGIWLYHREKTGARLLQLSSLLVQLLFGIACVTIASGQALS
jgi:hypothetical protein